MTAFRRSLAMRDAIAMAITAGLSVNILMNMPQFQYKSRGHCKGLIGKNYFNRSASKYKPHQGKKEIARRASQIERGILHI